MDQNIKSEFTLLELILLIKNNFLVILLIVSAPIIFSSYIYYKTPLIFKSSIEIKKLIPLQNKISFLDISEDDLFNFFYETSNNEIHINQIIESFLVNNDLSSSKDIEETRDLITLIREEDYFTLSVVDENIEYAENLIKFFMEEINKKTTHSIVKNLFDRKSYAIELKQNLNNMKKEEIMLIKEIDEIANKDKKEKLISEKKVLNQFFDDEHKNLLEVLDQNIRIAKSLGWTDEQFDYEKLITVPKISDATDQYININQSIPINNFRDINIVDQFIQNRFFGLPPYTFGSKILMQLRKEIEEGFYYEVVKVNSSLSHDIIRSTERSYSKNIKREMLILDQELKEFKVPWDIKYKYLLANQDNLKLVNFSKINSNSLKVSYYLYFAISFILGFIIALIYLLFRSQISNTSKT